MDKDTRALYFRFFNEIGIIAQLSRAVMESCLPEGLSSAHFGVLNHLVRLGDGRTPLAIARAFQVPKNSMTNTLAGLEKRGLIEMRPNPEDGRSKLVCLTDAGRAFRDDAIKALDPDMQMIGNQFDPEMISDLVPKLSEIRAFLDSRR
ncbi:MarR family transcriptional regulator [Nisaea sp.]|uniref:MarR family winged helix-turn-helix transcriptional regulator n=1 Tax=Nisaea sp. TaxID=2024842 RepID=UPI003266FBBF